jgi:hypothetical protein
MCRHGQDDQTIAVHRHTASLGAAVGGTVVSHGSSRRQPWGEMVVSTVEYGTRLLGFFETSIGRPASP